MPVIVPDTNVMQIMGGHPEWMEWRPSLQDDPTFRRLPNWYKYEVACLSYIDEAIPRCYSTAWVPPEVVMDELARGAGPARRSFEGWGGEIRDWARRWFWEELSDEDRALIGRRKSEAQQLDLDFLPDEDDRDVARFSFALRDWCSIVMTTDWKSFRSRKRQLAALGIAVAMPSEVWDVMSHQV